ncbi:auxilin-like clathrin-binding protein required for normal clathrin function [Scheffersomyces coipomensis]|uniref:auxilin-like clathrin-binding protein required for normal clathrin function n=1 Tax=Scheffersomyces coipomensis TaxID=1788519 RepID=UPI00315CE761
MAPPKKDAFADLFQSATTTSGTPKVNTLSMQERQKLQSGNGNGNGYHYQNNTSSYSNLDILSSSNSRISSPAPSINTKPIIPTSATTLNPRTNISNFNSPSSFASSTSSIGSNQPIHPPSIDNDPFDIFFKNDNKSNVQSPSQPTQQKPVANKVVNDFNNISLLDDDFTDAFEPAPPPKQVKPPTPVTPPQPRRPIPERPTSATAKKDGVIAELIDIGFSIDDANEAIREMGPDLQLCVNYIMNKNSKPNSQRNSPAPAPIKTNHQLPSRQQYAEDYAGINFNGIGQDLFNKANKLKKSVIHNIGKQLQNGNGGSSSGSGSNIPQWMKDQDKYKADAIEKKFDGTEDYGSDADNINQDDIDQFMRLQREKDKERRRTRLENAYNKATGSPKESSPAPPEPRLPQRRPQRQPQTAPQQPKPIIPEVPRRSSPLKRPQDIPTRNTDSERTPTTPKVQPPAPKIQVQPPKEVDLLGLSSSAATSSPNPSLRSATPLNQFQAVDYTTSKTTATEAFKSGDYDKALEFYSKCINSLPEKHENRVIIYSNLGNVYKLLGSLKKSLESVESGLILIDIKEVNSNQFEIDGKPIKYWFMKLILIKAEILELLEKFESSLDNYKILLSLNIHDKKIIDAKNRLDRIVNPQVSRPSSSISNRPPPSKSTPSPPVQSRPPSSLSSRPVKKIQDDEVDPLLKEQIDIKIKSWLQGKNFREVLITIDQIIPDKIKVKKVQQSDIVLNNKVKLNYLKIISTIHPDKTQVQAKDDIKTQLVCNGVFIALNHMWETFKVENNI